MKNRTIVYLLITVLIIGLVAWWYVNSNAQKPAPKSVKENITSKNNVKFHYTGLKSFYPLSPDGNKQIVQHKAYTICYNEDEEQPWWAIYLLTKSMVVNQRAQRQNNFKPDPYVLTGSSVPEDYKHSGYDRGHMVPAADMAWDKDAMSESFYMSNMSPQLPELNRGIWKTLEEHVRDLAVKDDSIVVIVGPSKYGSKEIGTKNRIGVPKYYFKIIINLTSPEHEIFCYYIPNSGFESLDLEGYQISLGGLEDSTCMKFFGGLGESF